MSVRVLDDAEINLLVTAAAVAGVVGASQGPDLGAQLLAATIDAYLVRYFGGADALDDDERDSELAWLVARRDGYTYTPTPPDALTSSAIRSAIDAWHYQVSATADPDTEAWRAMQRLSARYPA